MYPLSIKQLYLAVFNSSASSAAVLGLATDPFSILLGAGRSTQVTSQTNCLPSSQGARVIPSGRFPSDRVRPFGSKIEGTLIELRARVVGSNSNSQGSIPIPAISIPIPVNFRQSQFQFQFQIFLIPIPNFSNSNSRFCCPFYGDF